MLSSSMKSLLGGVVLAATPALADSTTTIPAFAADIAAARLATSPGGTTVIRAEMRGAVDRFLQDDSKVDAVERAYLADRINDLTFKQGVTATAMKYLIDTHELNDGLTWYSPLWLDVLPQTPADYFGATGPLTTSTEIMEGNIPNGQGVANQRTLTYKAAAAFGLQGVSNFTPITVQELLAMLKGHVINGTPNADEVDGALAFITQVSRNSNRLYTTGWSCQTYCGGGGPGDAGGFFIAAVSTERNFVRMVRVTTWSD
ncbi:hypothetical protein LXT21_35705 [Myxococcus sp. K38C18041901]|uniref:hypothetical protein n=1 Tax=Myxococcus guangdongensis TaxID=2906760 RepID=UPI0020A73F98|nr:hypothetical protein [Myxococcus guangdongensis]MCP3064132.1 hypothetical protein [Myxococcus guangdongensis]